MKRIALLAMIGFMFWGIPALAGTNPDFDGDGVGDVIDNCSEAANPAQDDTDADDCGNICDADYDQSGAVGFGDFGYWTHHCFGVSNSYNPLCDHLEPIGDDSVLGFGDFATFGIMYSSVPGPSGSTAGTIPCP
jgi:hypothetical protein